MSVSLIIEWANGAVEELPVASQRGAQLWAKEARDLGLALIPHFSSLLVIEPDRLPTLIEEMAVFRRSIAEKGVDYDQWREAADRLTAAFERLKSSGGWSASIG